MGPDGSQVSARRLQLHLGDLFDFPLEGRVPGVPGVPTIGGKGFGDWKQLTWFHVSSMRQQHDLVGGFKHFFICHIIWNNHPN